MVIKKFIDNIKQGQGELLEIAELILAIIVFFIVIYFSVNILQVFVYKDWSEISSMYDFISLVLVVLLGLEVVRLILVHNISVVMELMLLIIARKMLYPKIEAIELLYCVLAFCLVIATYYFYKLKPLKSLEDLTK